jgi:hypothetical protein
MRYILALVLTAPFMTATSMAQDAVRIDQHVYQGGPKSSVPHVSRETTANRAFAMVRKSRTSHGHSGGLQAVVPHSC